MPFAFAAVTLPIVVDFPSCSCQASPVLPSQLETSREFDKFPQKRYGELVTLAFFVGEFHTFLPPQARSIDTCRHSRQGGKKEEGKVIHAATIHTDRSERGISPQTNAGKTEREKKTNCPCPPRYLSGGGDEASPSLPPISQLLGRPRPRG